jgi:hypothetical protein
MTIQSIDLPSLVRAIFWPLLAVFALVLFRRPVGDLVTILGQRIHKFSFGGLSLELAEVSEMKTPILETEIRQLDASPAPQSGSSAISQLLVQLQSDRRHDYIVVDLGSESSRRWLTSRLYLLALLITLIDRPMCMVFVESVSGVRKRFLGTAAPDRVRWALARRYSWFESASAATWATLGGAYCITSVLTLSPTSSFQFDPTTGGLAEWQVTQLMQQFLTNIRAPQVVPPNANPDADEWISLKDGMAEHAKWLDGDRIERLLGSDLNVSSVALLPNQNVNELSNVVLRQSGRFVAIVDPDRGFRCLVDRIAALEGLARELLRQAAPDRISSWREGGNA